jgi:hypothetical protein
VEVCGVTSTIDLAQVRADTPGVAHVAHFNNAGAALPPRVVTEAITGHTKHGGQHRTKKLQCPEKHQHHHRTRLDQHIPA